MQSFSGFLIIDLVNRKELIMTTHDLPRLLSALSFRTTVMWEADRRLTLSTLDIDIFQNTSIDGKTKHATPTTLSTCLGSSITAPNLK